MKLLARLWMEETLLSFAESKAQECFCLSQHTLCKSMPKKKNKIYDYGECEVCDTPLQEKLVKQDFWIRGNLIVVENVPAAVCPRCGEKVVNAEVGRRIAELLQNAKRIAQAPRISVPAVRFDAELEDVAV